MTVPHNDRAGCSIVHFVETHRSWIFALVLVLASFFVPSSSQAQEERRLRAGYTSLSGNMLPLWAARDGGYFKKYGLDFDLISMPSGNEGMSALIAGELEFLAIAGSTTASAAIGGADVVALGTTVERLVAFLVVAPSIQKPGDQGQIGWHQSIRNVDRYGRKDGDSTLRPGADQGCLHRPNRRCVFDPKRDARLSNPSRA
jgi:hypothetical protein